MKQTLVSIIIGLVLSVSSMANVVYQPSGTHNIHIRVEGEAHYLLLPIEENAPEYRMQLVENNDLKQTYFVRLAARGKIDYYVPLDLSPYDLSAFYINVRVTDPAQLGGSNVERWEPSRSGIIAWDSIQTADIFDTTNREKYRPLYHHTPLYGWMNDPNGMYYDAQTGLWHLYYQYNPFCSRWQNMTWAHSVSSDLIHWEHKPNVLEPDASGTIFSGSCILDTANTAGFGHDAVIALYTSAAESQTQSLAYSNDGGLTFTKYPSNPIMTANIPDFRDPNMFWNTQTNEWNLTLACGQEMRFYASADLIHWRYLSSFGKDYGSHDGVWECPDLMQLPVRGTDEKKWVLLCNINPGGPFGGSATQYFVGDWDGKEFRFTPSADTDKVNVDQAVSPAWMDYGKDHYATVSFAHAPNGRHTVMIWMSNWQYANDVPTYQFRSANALPRDIDLFIDEQGMYRIGVRPAPEVEALRGKKSKTFRETAIIDVEITSSRQPALITLSNDKGEKVVLTYDSQAGTFSMDRTQSGNVGFHPDFPAVTTTPLFQQWGHSATKKTLTLYLDRCSLEVFDGDGCWAMTNLLFPNTPYNRLTLQNAKATIYSVNY